MIEQQIRNNLAQQVRYIQPVSPQAAVGQVAAIYQQIERDFGAVVPPLSLHSVAPAILAGIWLMAREAQVVTGTVSRHAKEAISAAISQLNRCPYCVDVHTTTLYALADYRTADAISAGRAATISDPKLAALVTWAGATRTPGSASLLHPPFTPAEAPEVIGTALAFHYINRMVNVFLAESPLPIPSRLRRLKHVMKRAVSPLLKGILQLAPTPGESLQFLPAADLPPDLRWAETNPTIADAFARVAAAMENIDQATLPDEVRFLVRAHVQSWQGEDLGLSRRWVEEAIQHLAPVQQPVARLALLTALAAYQVDESVIQAFRAVQPGDAKLVSVTAWSSFTTARRIGLWLHQPVDRSFTNFSNDVRQTVGNN